MRLTSGSSNPDKPTKNNELVRSTKEVFIANLLRRLGIRYEYEKELILDGERFVPDFYLTELDVYLEYFGLLSWTAYVKRTEYKLRRYAENKIKCIHLFSSSVVNINRSLRYELNKIKALGSGETYSYKAELPFLIMTLEKQPSFRKKRQFKWEPVLDRILLVNRELEGNLEILAKVLRKETAELKKRIKFLDARKRKEDLERIRSEAREKLSKLSIRRPNRE